MTAEKAASRVLNEWWTVDWTDAVVFRHAEDDIVVVWVAGQWVEFDGGRFSYQPSLDEATSAAEAERIGTAWLNEAEAEADESAARSENTESPT